MKHPELPQDVVPAGSSLTFTRENLPDALCREHSMGAKRWGVLQLLRGTVTFVELPSGAEREMEAPERMVIAPKAPHKLRLHDGDLECRVDFFQEVEEPARNARGDESRRDVLRQSFKRCEERGDFAARFYELFLQSAPEIGPLFAQTEFEKQRKLLRASVHLLATTDLSDPAARDLLARVGRSHSRSGLNIAPRLYAFWLESLQTTVQEMDPEWTPEMDQLWGERMRAGIQLITAAY